MRGKVSIVIPCFNHGRFLLETIESIEKARTARLCEVIVVNDGSTEPETMEVLNRLESSGYHIIHQENRRVAAARNTGIRVARGEFILPVDNDNRIRRTYLAAAVDLLESDSTLGVVYGDAEYFGEKTGRWTVQDFEPAELVKGNYIDACALFRKEMWEEVGGYDEHMPFMGWEDWDFWLRSALAGWGFFHLNEIAFDYRVRGGSMLTEANKHPAEILKHMFGKRELLAMGSVRRELHRLSSIESSREFRIGRRLLAPLRSIRAAIKRKQRGKSGFSPLENEF